MASTAVAVKAAVLGTTLAIASYGLFGLIAGEASVAGTSPLSAAGSLSGSHAVPANATEPSSGQAKSAPVCDGVSDDTAALQSMLDSGYDALSGTYKPIVVTIPVTPNGCVIRSALSVHSNTRIIQDGLVKLVGYIVPPTVEQRGMYNIVDNSENVVIEGAGTLDGNRAGHPSSFCCLGGIVSGGPEVGDYNANVRNITIRGLRIINTKLWPVSLDNATDVRIDSVTAENSGSSFQVGHDSHNVSVSNVHINGVQDIGFSFYRGIHNASLTNSVITGASGSGISVLVDSPPGVPVGQPNSNIDIVGNVTYGNNAGIDVIDDGSTLPSSGVNISSNVVHHNRTGGIMIVPCKNCQIVGNLIHDNGPGSNIPSDIAGIFIAHAIGLNVASNTIYNEGQGGPAVQGAGIIVNDYKSGVPATTRLTITGNTIYDDQSTKTMIHALYGNVLNPASVTGNTLGAMIGVRENFVYAPGSVASNISMP